MSGGQNPSLPDHIGGERPENRVCSRWVGGTFAGPDEVICGAPAVAHVLWVLTDDGYENGYVCVEHRGEVPGKFPAEAVHPVGHACGMPGSRVHLDGCWQDDLPVAEPVRTVAVASCVAGGAAPSGPHPGATTSHEGPAGKRPHAHQSHSSSTIQESA